MRAQPGPEGQLGLAASQLEACLPTDPPVLCTEAAGTLEPGRTSWGPRAGCPFSHVPERQLFCSHERASWEPDLLAPQPPWFCLGSPDLQGTALGRKLPSPTPTSLGGLVGIGPQHRSRSSPPSLLL